MERLVSPLRRWLRQIMEMPTAVLLRKLESTFYFLFLLLAVTCFTLPLVDDMNMAPFYIVAAFSVAYAIGFHFLRFMIHIHFGCMLHSGVFLSLLSTVFFESGHKKVGTAMIGIGILCVLIIIVFASLGSEVIVRNAIEQLANQAGQNANILNNNLIVAIGQLNHPNHVLANGGVIHHIPAFANFPVNHPNQDLPNGGNAILENGHAIQPMDDPEDQVDEAD